MPAPPDAVELPLGIAWESIVSLSTITKYEHLPNLGSSWESRLSPLAVKAIFISYLLYLFDNSPERLHGSGF
jgi:hypothetical protein